MKQLLYFTQPTCIPCKVYGPALETFMKDVPDVELIKHDDVETLVAWGIRGVPTTVLLDEDGKVINKRTGVMTGPEITDFLSV